MSRSFTGFYGMRDHLRVYSVKTTVGSSHPAGGYGNPGCVAGRLDVDEEAKVNDGSPVGGRATM
jgi:hypothetical protein